ncbi:hypothetical protein IAR55_005192 [Kwoniella newhampshirensis]|uniref:Zn(2)-C6 fungal-type domain-containing protein n=1 Tax=Kwoniella newhampshirensis TaxID=1651941 RepID=A0AAW0YGW1_9TREE
MYDSLSEVTTDHTKLQNLASTLDSTSPLSSSVSVHHDSLNPSRPPIASSSKRGVSFSSSGAPRRAKTGCITCRLRKKRCDETKPICATCSRLGIECLGYGAKRPDWLREKDNAEKAKSQIKQTVSSRRASRTKTVESADVDELSGQSESHRSSGSFEDLKPVGNFGGEGSGDGLAEPAARTDRLAWGHTAMSSSSPSEAISWVHATNHIGTLGTTESYSVTARSVPSFQTTSVMDASSMLSAYAIPAGPPIDEPGMDDLWTTLFGGPEPSVWGSVPAHAAPPAATPPGELSYLIPSPTAGPSISPSSDLSYLHHYLNNVLPLQYKLMGISVSMGEFVTPLALARTEVLASVSSLAALHIASQRARPRIKHASPSWARRTRRTGQSSKIFEANDEEAVTATTSHKKSIARLHFLSPQDLVAEEVIIPVVFAISYHLFSGGTSRHLTEILAVNQRCLTAALASSPELLEEGYSPATVPQGSLWSRCPHLLQHMMWIDIIASVSLNKTSRLLPAYRKLLEHLPFGIGTSSRPVILMDKVMGCDSTTMLALVETVALAEWRQDAEHAGSLSVKELLRRASKIEGLLDERPWRESHLKRPKTIVPGEEGPSNDVRRLMSDVFYGAAKVLLASVVNGPHPGVSDVAEAVQSTLGALYRLDFEYPETDIHRALVLPITIAGSHAESDAQQAYFRQCFERLGPEAKVFGNTGLASDLMEDVWRRRAQGGLAARVCWRETMVEMGWENGILLI